jgi:protein gp37
MSATAIEWTEATWNPVIIATASGVFADTQAG